MKQIEKTNLEPRTLNIWKYPLDFNNPTVINGCIEKVLDVQIQNNIPCMWAMVNPKGEYKTYEIIPFVTGCNYIEDGEYLYLGTIQVGFFVLHYFMREIKH